MPELTIEAHSEAQVALESGVRAPALAAGRGRLVARRAADERHDGRRGHAPARVPRHPPTPMRPSARPPGSAPSSARTAPGRTSTAGPGELSTTIEAYWALRLAGDRPRGRRTCGCAAEFIREQGGLERARVFTHVWLALFGLWSWERVPALPPEVDPAAVVGAAERLRLRLLGAPDDRRAVDRQSPPPGARARRSTSTSCDARPSRALEAPAARVARAWLASPGSPAARLRAPPARAAAPARARARRALDRAPPGGRRLVGRDPAAVGLLADRAAPRRLSARAPRDAARPGRDRALHGRGSRRRSRVASGGARRCQPAPGSVPVAGLGHGAGDGRAQRRRPRRTSTRRWCGPPSGCSARR